MKGLLLFLLLGPLAVAHAGSGGSAYSIFGLGDLRVGGGTRSDAMGGAGIGLADGGSINGLSPAAWSRIGLTRLEAGLLYEGFRSSDGSRSLYRASGDFHGALLAVPVSIPDGIVFVSGFTPFSHTSYNTFTEGEQAGVAYTINHAGSGGLGRALAGLSWAPLPWLSAGASLDYLFGSVEHLRRVTALSLDTLPASGSNTTESISMNGITVTAGLLVSGQPSMPAPLDRLSLGLVLTSRGALRASHTAYREFAASRDTSGETQGRVVIPPGFGVGLAWRASERMLLVADYHRRNWSAGSFLGGYGGEIRDAERAGAGVERAPLRNPSAPWYDRISWRAGLSYEATYYSVNGRGIGEWLVTCGAGIPFSGDSRINLALAYGRRGTLEGGLIRDDIIRVTLGVGFSELWFTRFEEE
ncbi:MAG: hypothetical protein WB626_03660 [Bacteroidota bacterium]